MESAFHNPTPRPCIEVRPSARRQRTCSARFEGDRIVVLVPARLPASERQRVAEELAARLLRRAAPKQPDHEHLARRAAKLSAQYPNGKAKPSEVRWVTNQEKTRWGSCTSASGEIRVSARLRGVPEWVLNYVLVHELAHLLVPNHGPAFKSLVARYPRAREAISWLEGYDYGLRMASSHLPPLS